jgi:hypothetical protein
MTPAELSALAAEIKNDPAGLGYAAHLPFDPVRVVDLINMPTYTMLKTRYVTARTILAECADGAALLDALQAAAANVSAVKWMMTFLQQDSGMDAGHPKTQANIDELVAAGMLSSAFGAELKNIALQPASRAEIINVPAPTARDIVDAWSKQ